MDEIIKVLFYAAVGIAIAAAMDIYCAMNEDTKMVKRALIRFAFSVVLIIIAMIIQD